VVARLDLGVSALFDCGRQMAVLDAAADAAKFGNPEASEFIQGFVNLIGNHICCDSVRYVS
jgi:hypothetical protein